MVESAASPSEIEVSQAWYDGRITAVLRTVDNRPIRVVHRGTWSHGLGPDFRDAMVEFDGKSLANGSVEIHLRTSAWRMHGHHLDPRYNDVVLHVVLHHDAAETRRQDGALVPVVEIGKIVPSPHARSSLAVDWSRFGGAVCAEALAARQPAAIRSALWELGDRRLASKVARIEARLTATTPAEVLYQELWDGFGYASNREPMRAVAERLRVSAVEELLATVEPARRLSLARAVTFGVAGFLPLSPADANVSGVRSDEVAEIDELWRSRGAAWHDLVLPPTIWTRARVRPANHPARRLSAGAALLSAATGGIVTSLMSSLRQRMDPVAALRTLTRIESEDSLGVDRASGMVGNVVIPFALALSELTDDRDLADSASLAWEQLPAAESNHVTRRAQRQVSGAFRLSMGGFRGQQGLIFLDQILCAPRRCYECPIARCVLSDEG